MWTDEKGDVCRVWWRHWCIFHWKIDGFRDVNRVNSNNFKATLLKRSVELNHFRPEVIDAEQQIAEGYGFAIVTLKSYGCWATNRRGLRFRHCDGQKLLMMSNKSPRVTVSPLWRSKVIDAEQQIAEGYGFAIVTVKSYWCWATNRRDLRFRHCDGQKLLMMSNKSPRVTVSPLWRSKLKDNIRVLQ